MEGNREVFTSNIGTYAEKIKQLPNHTPLVKQDLLIPDFLLEKQGETEIYYSPHNDFVEHRAQVVIIGITPGWYQMELAFRTARDDLKAGYAHEDVAIHTKQVAGLAGPMRAEIIRMLDRLGLAGVLRIESSRVLFDSRRDLLHTTSMIKYPVFVQGRNYTGHQPDWARNTMLRAYIEQHLRSEFMWVGRRGPLIVPLGKTVGNALREMVAAGLLQDEQCLFGFPHPSGANGHRFRQFDENENSMRQVLHTWLTGD